MAEEIKTNWKEEEDGITSKDDFLNGLLFKDVSGLQQMLYLLYKKIEELEVEINILKGV